MPMLDDTLLSRVRAQRALVTGGQTLDESRRRALLMTLKAEILRSEADIVSALHSDLGKSAGEAYMTEIGMVLAEISHTLKHLHAWMKPKRVRTPMAQFPAKSRIYAEPYGQALIMAPWNYPFQLTMTPLVGALSAGNRCVLKPSNYSPATSRVIEQICARAAGDDIIIVAQGGREANQALLDERFDYIFFTGGLTVGRLVMEKAARHVTPVSLELGGKSPCIVDDSADIAIAAKRIAFGKALNSGQTCVAPDYLLVHEAVKEQLLAGIRDAWKASYGENALSCAEYPHMISQKHYERVMGLIDGQNVYCGGAGDGTRIAPTILDNVSWDAPVMQEEIFGPVLPVITFSDVRDVPALLRAREKPLALYLFTRRQEIIDLFMRTVPFGGGCVNDTVVHLTTPHMPFGGVGQSGMGGYHGKRSFDTFTHEKSVLLRGNHPDLSVRYPPFDQKKTALVKKLLK